MIRYLLLYSKEVSKFLVWYREVNSSKSFCKIKLQITKKSFFNKKFKIALFNLKPIQANFFLQEALANNKNIILFLKDNKILKIG